MLDPPSKKQDVFFFFFKFVLLIFFFNLLLFRPLFACREHLTAEGGGKAGMEIDG